jgi:hypothetical protein
MTHSKQHLNLACFIMSPHALLSATVLLIDHVSNPTWTQYIECNTEFYKKMKTAYDEGQRGNKQYFENVNVLLMSALTISILYCLSKQ